METAANKINPAIILTFELDRICKPNIVHDPYQSSEVVRVLFLEALGHEKQFAQFVCRFKLLSAQLPV